MKKIGIICLIPVLLVVLAIFLLYIPFVQCIVVKKAAQLASESLHMRIDIEKIHLSFPLNLKAGGITVIDHETDTLLYLNNLTARVRLLPLLAKNISVRTLQLSDVRFNTKSLIEGTAINGHIGDLVAGADKINLTAENALLNHLRLSDSYISLRIDTAAASDTTSSVVKWKIDVENIRLENISFAMQMPADTFSLNTYFKDVSLAGGQADLEMMQYKASHFRVRDSHLRYDFGIRHPAKGLNPLHLDLSGIDIELDAVLYRGKNINAEIPHLSLKEKSGLFITSLNGKITSEGETWIVPELVLNTPYSKIEAQATVPWSSLDDALPEGNLSTRLIVSLDKRDVLAVAGEAAELFERFYPNTAFKLGGWVEGNLNKIYLKQLESELPGLFKISAHGMAEKITDDIARSGEFYLKAQTSDDGYLRGVLLKESGGRYSLPDQLFLDLKASLTGGEYQADLLLSEQSGNIKLDGKYHPSLQNYGIDLKVDSLALIRFLPKDSIFNISANVKAQGHGLDLFAGKTWAQLEASVSEIIYKGTPVSGISLNGSLKDHQLQARMTSNYPFFQADMTVEGNMTKEKVSGTLMLDVNTFDLQGLQLSKRPFTNSFRIFSEAASDLKKNHRLDVTLGDWEMAFDRDRRVRPKPLALHAKSSEDSTQVSFRAGDLDISLTGNADLESLVNKLNVISNHATAQLKADSAVDLRQLRPLLPEIDLQVSARKDNPVYNYLQMNNIFFDRFEFNASTSPESGLNADGLLSAFIKDTLKIDSVQLCLRQDSDRINYTVDVIKNKFRRQEPFRAGLKGGLQFGRGDVEAFYLDGQGKTGLYLGARVEKQAQGWNIQVFPENPVIAFLPFRVNPDNYVLFKSKENISANLRLDGEEYASVWIHSEEEAHKMKELSAEFNQIDLKKLSAGFSGFIPPLEGNANLSLRYAPNDHTFMVVADAGVDDLYYQQGRIGEILMSGVYLPLDNSRHQVDMHMFHDQNEVSTLTGTYQSAQGNIDGKATVNQLPLMMLNPVLAGTARLNGALQGTVSVHGTAQAPLLNGYMQMDTATVYVTAAGSRIRLDNKRIPVADSKISFDKYSIYSAGNNPFVIDGSVNIRNMAKGTADLTLTAKNMQLLDAKKEDENLVYGKLFVDLNSTVKGPLDGLTMRGNLHLLGGTDMSYILRESPLTVQNRMAGLVTFTYFRDTIPQRNRIGNFRSGMQRETTSLNNGMEMLITVNIDPVVKFKIDLDEKASDRIELRGGGNLSFQYTRQGDMVLNGRYTLSEGILKYNMPVIGNKILNIQDNSYVEWRGDVMDPYLNLTATERVRTPVNQDGESSRLITFDAGVNIKQRLENLSLRFTLDAVDDAAMQNQLIAMGTDEESKRAVAMLLTGMYISDDQAGNMGFNMGSALNNFLANEVNNLTGNLLGGVDFNFGMETYDVSGGNRTDYTFRFSKRLYNDRLNVIVGGALSTGEMADENNNFINDASLEYRLDRGGNKYAKLFYNRQYESLLEGEIARFGGGFIFRRKMRRLSELFGIRSRKTTIRNEAGVENKER
ncbi:MAG: translocation/assembly module TamB domain-containing protein [Tannerella sp.]|nr:translocation/assembly module TamB domain-containing protein [Tannerella sp.]